MLEDDHALGHALGARGSDIILLHDLEHRGTGHARDVRDGGEGEARHRQDVVLPCAQAVGRQPLEHAGEQIQQQNGDDEQRHAHADGRDHHGYAVKQAAALDRGGHAQQHADHQRQQHRQNTDARGNREAALDQVVDLHAGILIGNAEVAVENLVEVGEILFIQRLIQTVFLVEALHDGLGHALLAFGKRAAGNGMHQKEAGGNQNDNGDDTR